MKGTPGINPETGVHASPGAAWLHRISSRLHGDNERKYTFQRARPDPGADRQVRQIINLLNYTKTCGTAYDAQSFPAGYHTLEISGVRLAGQRNPRQRLSIVPLDFKGKSILDIGCAQGGMLFEIAGTIRYGVGIDYDAHKINAANRIRSFKNTNNLAFYVFDLEKEDLDIVRDLVPDEKVDVAFLLSICMWIRNWKQVVALMPEVSEMLLFESNGTRNQQEEQVACLKARYRHVRLLSGDSADDSTQRNRGLYLCE